MKLSCGHDISMETCRASAGGRTSPANFQQSPIQVRRTVMSGKREVTMKVPVVDRDLCTGCGACCPAVFEMGDDDVAVAKNPSGAEESAIQEAIDSCPAEAISWNEK